MVELLAIRFFGRAACDEGKLDKLCSRPDEMCSAERAIW